MNPSDRPQLLFVDDEPRVLASMKMLFFGTTYTVHCAEGGARALEFLRNHPVDVIVSDQRMPGMSGVEFLRAARELRPQAMRILLTGYSDLTSIIGSINDGEIFRFVNKPWANEDLTTTVARAAAAARASIVAAAAPDSPHAALPYSLLVLDEDPAVAPRMRQILGNGVRVYAAASMQEAADLLESEPIGVIVSDTRLQEHSVVELIGTLKQHHPELVSVILTERADAGMAIELINRGQVYRFITKPIQDLSCRIAVDSALRQHQRLAHRPDLQSRYAVQEEPAATTADASSAVSGVLQRIRSLRNWVARRP
jgi:DNA-binding NtrC family response regulator